MSSEIERDDKQARQLTNIGTVDFSAVLVRTLESIQEDPAQLRNAIYELARIKLQQEAWARNPPISVLESRRLMLALETAIERVEAEAAKNDDRRYLNGDGGGGGSAPMLIDRSRIDKQGSYIDAEIPTHPKSAARSWPRPTIGPILRASVVLVLFLTSLFALNRQFSFSGPNTEIADRNVLTIAKSPPQSSPAIQADSKHSSSTVGAPLPQVYGVYAVNHGQLIELAPLVGRVPDQRVFMSTPVKTPSHTVLPEGPLKFVVYRRDIAANPPAHVSIRVIAKVIQTMTFAAAGRPKTIPLEDEWTIRSTTFDFRVAPTAGNPEILTIQPDDPDLILPAGRYGLVLKGQAYDFTVAGPITDPAQCLERIEAANGAFYSECPRQ